MDYFNDSIILSLTVNIVTAFPCYIDRLIDRKY